MSDHTPAIQKRIDYDLLSRSTIVIAAYSTIYPIIFYAADFYTLHPQTSWLCTITAWLLSGLRVIHRILTNRFYDRSPRTWMRILSCLTLSHGLLMGSFFAFVVVDAGMAGIYNSALFVLAGVSSGSISTLSPKLPLSLMYIQTLLAPGIFATIFVGDIGVNTFTMILYLGYLSAVSVLSSREYLRTFKIEAELEIQKQDLERLSRTDALTGIYNRGYFNTILDLQWETSIRNGSSLTLIIIDADHFKCVNDRFGHSSGDECLIRIAEIMKQILKRKTDICSRYGGEEFIALIGSTPIDQAEKLAEKIRSAIEQSPIRYSDNHFQITVSIGLANINPRQGLNPSALIDRADKALYQAKEMGRNQVKTYKKF